MDLVRKYLGEGDIPTYYSAEYYDKQGGHGEIGNWPSFKTAYSKAMELYKREKKQGLLGTSTGYIGVAGSGDEFAIIFLDQNYLKNMSQNDFKDQVAYRTWMNVAKKVLSSGKPAKGTY
jgi:hypothetical protein